jgi:UDP-N-acetylmuramate dehydrogenase
MNWKKALKKIVEGKVRFSEPMCKHTTWRVGGLSDVFVEPKDLTDLSKVIKFSKVKKLPIFVIGAGSNLLVSEAGIRGIVIKLSQPFFKSVKFKRNSVWAGAGLSLNRLVALTRDKDLSGCEFLAGIPGTLGGALVMNAGARDISSKNGRQICLADLVKKMQVLSFTGKEKILNKKEIKFGYRNSNLSKFIIISVKLELKSESKKTISALIKKFISYKKGIQDLKSNNAGCVFKNPINSENGNLTAGKMIDSCGLKGKTVGSAGISEIHANFILNKGGAKPSDIFKLMRLVQKKVKHKFNVSLEPEVKIIGAF